MADQPTEARLALYRKLSTEHLQTLLRSDLDGPPLDEATVDSILTVLAERRSLILIAKNQRHYLKNYQKNLHILDRLIILNLISTL